MANPVQPVFPTGTDVQFGLVQVNGNSMTQLDPTPGGTELVHGMWISTPKKKDIRVATQDVPVDFALFVRKEVLFFMPIRNTNDAWVANEKNGNLDVTWMAG